MFFGTAIIAFILSIALKSDPKTTLYCVSPNTPFSIFTLNTTASQAQCFRVQKGHFTEIISDAASLSETDKPVFLDGYVIPGIIESHGHIMQYGEMLESVSLYGAASVEEVRSRIKRYLELHAGEGYGTKEKWVRGIGWNQEQFGGVMPTAVCAPKIPLPRILILIKE
jgi:predicted amidohydrolase YtcJ